MHGAVPGVQCSFVSRSLVNRDGLPCKVIFKAVTVIGLAIANVCVFMQSNFVLHLQLLLSMSVMVVWWERCFFLIITWWLSCCLALRYVMLKCVLQWNEPNYTFNYKCMTWLQIFWLYPVSIWHYKNCSNLLWKMFSVLRVYNMHFPLRGIGILGISVAQNALIRVLLAFSTACSQN